MEKEIIETYYFNPKEFVNGKTSDGITFRDVKAQYQLGLCYEFGYGVPKDFKKATFWFKKAAAQGHARAKLILELRLFVRLGMAEDYTGVIKWFKNIAERKHSNVKRRSE